MIIAGNQSYFFPYLGYFQLINAVDKFIISDNLIFVNKGWVNRNNILVRNAGTHMVTVPLLGRTSTSRICDLRIDDQNGTQYWRKKLCKTIYVNYRYAPMFPQVFPWLESLINFPTDSLSELNANAIISICEYLNIKTIIEKDYGKYYHIENLLNNENYITTNYGNLESRTIRIIEICKYEGAGILYNSFGGSLLYSKEIFKKNNIEIKFLAIGDIRYKQYTDVFVPNLSVIDVLMFNDTDKINAMLSNYSVL